MLPDNVLSTEVIRSTFQPPGNITRTSLLEDYELGGVALQDPSQGHQVQVWYSHVDSSTGNIYVRPGVAGTDILIGNQSNIFEYAFAFDQNMRWMNVYTLVDGTTYLNWYDSSIPGYTTITYTGINSVRLTLDDSRETFIQNGSSDVILTYLKTATNELCARIQRERFLTEHILQTGILPGFRITHFGMSNIKRMQWRIAARTYEERIPWLP